MRAKYFTYAGESLSDYNLVIAGTEDRSGDEITTDSQRTFNSISMFNGKYQPFISTVYDDRLEMELTIMRDPCSIEDKEKTDTLNHTQIARYNISDEGSYVANCLIRLTSQAISDETHPISAYVTMDGDADSSVISNMWYGVVRDFPDFDEYKDAILSYCSETDTALFFDLSADISRFAESDVIVITYTNKLGIGSFELSQNEVRNLKRWLSRPTPHKLKFDEEQFSDIYWMGSFNVKEVYVDGAPHMLNLTFVSNRPFALREESVFTGNLEVGNTLEILDGSDEEGYIYPTMRISCLSGGNLELSITSAGSTRTTIINNCEQGEIITFSPLLQIRSSRFDHDLGADFNYVFPRISNNYYDETRINTITSSIPVDYEIRYNEIAKAVIS